METRKIILVFIILRWKNFCLKIISIKTFLDESGEGLVLRNFSHFLMDSQIHSNILVVIKMIFIISLFFFCYIHNFLFSNPRGYFPPLSDSARLRLASLLNYPLFLFSSIFLESHGVKKSQKENLQTWDGTRRCGWCGRMGIVPCCFVINLRNVKMMLTVDEIFFVAVFFSFSFVGMSEDYCWAQEKNMSLVLS